MDHQSASISKNETYREEKISFDEVPNQSRLFLDYQKDFPKLAEFYPSKDKNLAAFSSEVLANYEVDRNKLCEVLRAENESYSAGDKTFENIEKLRSENCVAVLTGQQAGLFTGPIYTIFKALSAIKLASELTENGTPSVPVFWIASEDHDLDEISKTFFLDDKGAVNSSDIDIANDADSKPIGFVSLGENISESIEEFIGLQSNTEFTAELRELLNHCYRARESFSSAFGKTLARIFSDYGLIFVSALNSELRNLSKPIFTEAIENSQDIRDNLLTRNVELDDAGYHSQVLVEEDFFPFFYIDKEKKRKSIRVDADNGNLLVRDSDIAWTKEALIEIANDDPESFSPNALMRPIVQDYLFPTVCYFGGGAEIAYFGQNSVIYECLNRPQTPIRHRSSFTLVAGKQKRNMEKCGLEFSDLFAGEERVLSEIVKKQLNPETSAKIARVKNEIGENLESLKSNLVEVEPTLAENLENREKKILWHINTLEKKFERAELLKDEVNKLRVEGIFSLLLPYGVLQERNLNFLYFQNLYGDNLLDWIFEAVDTNEVRHQILYF